VADVGLITTGCDLAILVDDEKVGQVKWNSVTHFATTAGKHRVKAAMGDLAGSLMCTNFELTRIVTMDKEGAVFRIGYTGMGQFIFDQIE
jgi:hypothetical protein